MKMRLENLIEENIDFSEEEKKKISEKLREINKLYE